MFAVKLQKDTSNTVKNNPVKKNVNYWQLWLLASYRNNTVCYCFCAVKLKFYSEADNTALFIFKMITQLPVVHRFFFVFFLQDYFFTAKSNPFNLCYIPRLLKPHDSFV